MCFVRLEKALCTPANLNWSVPAKIIWAEMLKFNQTTKGILEKPGVSYPAVAGFFRKQSTIHITRIKGFNVSSMKELIKIDKVEKV